MSETLESSKPKAETHKTMGGKVNIYRRENSDNWQCSTFLNGRNWRVSTHEDSLARAKDFAADGYIYSPYDTKLFDELIAKSLKK